MDLNIRTKTLVIYSGRVWKNNHNNIINYSIDDHIVWFLTQSIPNEFLALNLNQGIIDRDQIINLNTKTNEELNEIRQVFEMLGLEKRWKIIDIDNNIIET